MSVTPAEDLDDLLGDLDDTIQGKSLRWLRDEEKESGAGRSRHHISKATAMSTRTVGDSISVSHMEDAYRGMGVSTKQYKAVLKKYHPNSDGLLSTEDAKAMTRDLIDTISKNKVLKTENKELNKKVSFILRTTLCLHAYLDITFSSVPF